MENYITIILQLISEVNEDYRTSRYPKFIRNILAKKRRSKIKKTINKIHNMKAFDYSLIRDFFDSIYLAYPPYGVFKNCKKIEPVSPEENSIELSALFEFTINEETKETGVVALSPDSKGTGSYLIRYVWVKNGTTIFVNAEENVRVFENTLSYEKNSYPYSAMVENSIIKDLFIKYLLDNIYEYLMEAVKRSERLTDYDRIQIK